jgi:hypothetical protein
MEEPDRESTGGQMDSRESRKISNNTRPFRESPTKRKSCYGFRRCNLFAMRKTEIRIRHFGGGFDDPLFTGLLILVNFFVTLLFDQLVPLVVQRYIFAK